jgi:hypothetical protein
MVIQSKPIEYDDTKIKDAINYYNTNKGTSKKINKKIRTVDFKAVSELYSIPIHILRKNVPTRPYSHENLVNAVNFYKENKGKTTQDGNELVKITIEYVSNKFDIPKSTLADNLSTTKDISTGNIF